MRENTGIVVSRKYLSGRPRGGESGGVPVLWKGFRRKLQT